MLWHDYSVSGERQGEKGKARGRACSRSIATVSRRSNKVHKGHLRWRRLCYEIYETCCARAGAQSLEAAARDRFGLLSSLSMALLSAPGALLASCCSSLPLLGLFLATFLLCLRFLKRRKSWSAALPGPPSRPFVGNLLQVDFDNLPKSFTQLSKKYGNIFRFQFVWKNLLVVNGFEAVKETIINEDTVDRPSLPLLKQIGFKKNSEGIVFARYGQAWKDMRRFSLSTLRNFGLGKKSLDERIGQEASCLCSAFESEEGNPFDPHFLINNAVSNVICSIVFGDRFEYTDKKFQRMLHLFEEALKSGGGFLPLVMNQIPVLMNIPWLLRKVIKPQLDLMHFTAEIIKEHQKTWDPEITRDFIDAFLLEIEKTKDNPSSTFSQENLLFTTSDLFGAGTETTSTTLRWGLLYMLLYPDVQRRVHEEIDSVIGRDRKPTMQDQVNMPFTNAVIHETQRCGDIAPLAAPHMTCRDTEIQGYFIPKGVSIFINLSSVLKDETVWERPHQFHPEHFLDADGKFMKREAFIPFSAEIPENAERPPAGRQHIGVPSLHLSGPHIQPGEKEGSNEI
ncbi:cytochrome P450 2D17-like isoform X2 [Ambystoma mexicanum]|uniref:cytochrome P450 2D17-like isoform X2 n=1 Tax=Ambystoma mexicanum TaxID=8296 RepID=UPI0037E873C6